MDSSGGGPRRFGKLVEGAPDVYARLRDFGILWVDLDAYPLPPQLLGCDAGRPRADEGIENHAVGRASEFDEVGHEFDGFNSWMYIPSFLWNYAVESHIF